MTTDEMMAKMLEMAERLEQLTKQQATVVVAKGGSGVPKNQQPQVPDPNRYYVFANIDPRTWGKVPRQQFDVAMIVHQFLPHSVELSEKEVFDTITREAINYQSLATSVQDENYLFKYYKSVGPGANGKGTNYIKLGFLRQIDK